MREAERKKLKEEMAVLLGTNKSRRTGNPDSRTGVRSKSFKQLQQESFICKTVRIRTGVGHTFIFVVSRVRGFKEFVRVSDHDKKVPRFSRYGESLLQSCFKHWN